MQVVKCLLIFRNQKIKHIQIAVKAFSTVGSLDNKFLSFDTVTLMQLCVNRFTDALN